MKSIPKRLLAFVLALLLVLTSVPAVFAADEESESSTGEPEKMAAPPPDFEVIDDSTPIESIPPLLDSGISLMSVFNCQVVDWAITWVNTDEYSPVKKQTNRFIYYEFPAGVARERNNISIKAVKVNGVWTPAYCIEPGVPHSSFYTEEDMTLAQYQASDLKPATLTREQIEAMSIAVMFGEHNLPQSDSNERISSMLATQLIVWEIAIGWRDSTPPYTQRNDAFIRRYKNVGNTWPEASSSYIKINTRLKTIITSYNAISEKMANYSAVLPSFAGKSQEAAPSIELLPDGNGNYTASVTDTNGVLSGFTLRDTEDLTFRKDGNLLTITAKKPVSDCIIVLSKDMPDLENHVFFVWYNGSYQAMIGSGADPAMTPLNGYLRVTAREPNGSLKLVKTTNTGNHVSGWEIGVYEDQACSIPIPGSPFTTGSDGTIQIPDLAPGTLYTRELAANDPFWHCDTSVHTVTITAGQTATDTWKNTELGLGKLRKVTDSGTDLEGWQIILFRDEACTQPIAAHTTDENGLVSVYLEPGIYYAKETGDAHGRFESNFWECDAAVKKLEILPHKETEIAFTNHMQIGEILLEKTDTLGHPLSGAEFLLEWSADGADWNPISYSQTPASGTCSNASVKNGLLTTDADGRLDWGGLDPQLQYRLTETKAPEGFRLLAEPAFEGILSGAKDLTVALRVVNAREFTLPETGSTELYLLHCLSVLALTAGIAVSAYGLRRKEREV